MEMFEPFRAAAERHAAELLEELGEFDRNRLAEVCRDLGAERVHRHVGEHRRVMLHYVRRTPARRADVWRKVEADSDNRMMFVLCAAYLARCALALLDRMAEPAQRPIARSARHLTCWAAEAALEIRYRPPSLWPFDDGRDPFEEGL